MPDRKAVFFQRGFKAKVNAVVLPIIHGEGKNLKGHLRVGFVQLGARAARVCTKLGQMAIQANAVQREWLDTKFFG